MLCRFLQDTKQSLFCRAQIISQRPVQFQRRLFESSWSHIKTHISSIIESCLQPVHPLDYFSTKHCTYYFKILYLLRSVGSKLFHNFQHNFKEDCLSLLQAIYMYAYSEHYKKLSTTYVAFRLLQY